jgi:hypothetical protein
VGALPLVKGWRLWALELSQGLPTHVHKKSSGQNERGESSVGKGQKLIVLESDEMQL